MRNAGRQRYLMTAIYPRFIIFDRKCQFEWAVIYAYICDSFLSRCQFNSVFHEIKWNEFDPFLPWVKAVVSFSPLPFAIWGMYFARPNWCQLSWGPFGRNEKSTPTLYKTLVALFSFCSWHELPNDGGKIPISPSLTYSLSHPTYINTYIRIVTFVCQKAKKSYIYGKTS